MSKGLTSLWFAFILWTTDIYNNIIIRFVGSIIVVICFHSLNYWYLQQPDSTIRKVIHGCDLLSFFELLIFTTTAESISSKSSSLWFAFILWTTDIYNNFTNIYFCIPLVVICFHSLNYWYLQQHLRLLIQTSYCCDLLSFFELLIFTTTSILIYSTAKSLWFAFILWTTDIYNNSIL